MSIRFSPRLQPQRSTHRSDPAVVSVETPPRKAGANDVAASIEYLRAKEKRLVSR
jgi:hypothetical protein